MDFERVVVTGGSGRLGRFVVDELREICAVCVLDIARPRQDVPYFEADILDPEAVRAALAGQDGIGREDTLARLTAVYGRLPEVRDPALYANDPYASVLDNRKARDRLGWEPKGDWTAIAAEHGAG